MEIKILSENPWFGIQHFHKSYYKLILAKNFPDSVRDFSPQSTDVKS